MDKPLCFVIPGFAGSTLQIKSVFGGYFDLWLSYLNIAGYQYWPLQLDVDGLSPGPQAQDYHPAVGGLLPAYYAALVEVLNRDFDVAAHPWDWRHSLEVEAAALATRIKGLTQARSCYIVAHSAGGLLARYALKLLGPGGGLGAITRLVCLGTPHYGSFQAMRMFTHQDVTYRRLAALAGLNVAAEDAVFGRLFGVVTDRVFGAPRRGFEVIDQVLATFPSLYQLLPFTAKLSSYGGSEVRNAIYDRLSYAPVNPELSSTLLARQNAIETFLADAIYPSQMLNVVGYGQRTVTALDPGLSIYDDRGIITDYLGDGVTPAWSAGLPGVPFVQVQAAHDELGYTPKVLDSIGRWLLGGAPTATDLGPTGEEIFVGNAQW